MFSYKNRVHTEQFEEILKKGKNIHSPLFSISYVKAPNKAFAVVASKKVSKKAVVRNKNKRRVRHILKTIEENCISGLYIIFIKKDLARIPHGEIKEEIVKIIGRV